jgi:hypothetical protein
MPGCIAAIACSLMKFPSGLGGRVDEILFLT